jgi:hypothetical protein
MANTPKSKKKVTWVKPPVDLTDPELTDEEIEKVIDEMSKGMVEALMGKQDWEGFEEELKEDD